MIHFPDPLEETIALSSGLVKLSIGGSHGMNKLSYARFSDSPYFIFGESYVRERVIGMANTLNSKTLLVNVRIVDTDDETYPATVVLTIQDDAVNLNFRQELAIEKYDTCDFQFKIQLEWQGSIV